MFLKGSNHPGAALLSKVMYHNFRILGHKFHINIIVALSSKRMKSSSCPKLRLEDILAFEEWPIA